jgi:hypothetical protein
MRDVVINITESISLETEGVNYNFERATRSLRRYADAIRGQANKSIRWMPRH